MIRLRVLRVYSKLPPCPGGMENHVFHLTQEQRKLSCTVTLFYNAGDPTAKEDRRVLPSIPVHRIRPHFLGNLFFYIGAYATALRERDNFDVVHIHGDWSDFLLGKVLQCLVRAPRSIASVHGAITRRSLFWKLIYRLALAGYNAAYATGADDASFLSKLSRRTVTWQNSGIAVFFRSHVTPSEYISARPYDVVSVSNFTAVKNTSFLIDIASKMQTKRFLLIGDGPELIAVKKLVAERQLTNVTFLGRQPAPALPQALDQAKIFLLTSFSEGTSTAMIEAMARGLPVVTSRSNDYSGIIFSGVNGAVIDKFDATLYADTISMFLMQPELLRRANKINRNFGARNVWPEVARKITSLCAGANK